MSRVGKIIEALNKPFAKIKEHNTRVDAKEKRLEKIVRDIREWSYVIFPLLLSAGLAGWGGHNFAQERKKINTAIENVKVGNYNIAKEQFGKIEEEQGIGELENIIVGLDRRELYPDQAMKYGELHAPGNNFILQKHTLGNPTTSLEKITASDGKEFYAIANPAGISFINETTRVKMGLMDLFGRMYAHEKGLIAAANTGMIYNITLSEEDGAYKPMARMIHDAGSKISEIRASSDGYFFTTESGVTRGIDADGKMIFSTPAQKEPPRLLIPPTIADVFGTPDKEIVYYQGDGLHINTVDDKLEFRVELEGTPYNEILVGDVDGDTKKDILAMTDDYAYLLLSKDKWEPQQIDVPTNKFPHHRWTLADLDNDGIDDLLYGGGSFTIVEGSKKKPLSIKWDFPEGVYYIQNYSDNESHRIFGIGEDTLFITRPFSKPMFQFGIGQEFSGDRVIHGTLNGKRYLTFATDEQVFMIGDGWFGPLSRRICEPGGSL